MIYKIDHYYSVDHDKYCLMISTDIALHDLIYILASIQFLFEELIDDSICADDMHLLELLEEFYSVRNVKEEYRQYLPFTHIQNERWEIYNIFDLKRFGLRIYQIDLYEARESCCGPQYIELMNKYLPKGDKLINFKKKIESYKSFYLD